MELALGYEILGLLFAVALIAGFIDTIAGGGGILVLPVLLSVGFPPIHALGTNKLQSVGGSFSASLYFVRRKVVDLKQQRWVILATFIGGMIGVCLVQYVRVELLRQMLPVLLIAVAIYFLLSPKLGIQVSKQRLTLSAFALSAGAPIGFYDGFFGPGAGSFYALAYVALLGLTLPQATAHAKVLNFTSNIVALIFFALGGYVIWHIGLIMLVGQFIGARLGANLVLTKGQKLIRPMLVLMSTLMSIKLIYDNHYQAISAWLAGMF